ncbi:fumarylacetoacetate hydrolase family protein [Kosakonia sp. H02]|nr:fumarylacetoacetate hydrolase family protein [Kosakonia sp. H02]
MENNIQKAGDLLRKAQQIGVAGKPIHDIVGDNDIDTAYRVQAYNHQQWQNAGRRLVGRKLALTNKAVQQQFGISQACHGFIYADTVLSDGAEITQRALSDQRVETEIAVVLKKDLIHSQHTVLDVIDACDYLLAAFEIVDSRVIDWNVNACDFVADNTSASLVVLGTKPVYLKDCDITRCQMVTWRGDDVVSEGVATNCLGHPLQALAWLADEMVRAGRPLRAGEFVITGAMGPAISAKPGDVFSAELSGIGSIAVSFAK